MGFVVFTCQGCGSGIGVQPDNLLTLCQACGRIYPSRDLEDVPVHIVTSVSQEKVRSAFNRRMASDKQMKGVRIDVTHISGQYVPLYIQRVEADGSWAGYRYEKRGKNRVKVRLNGDFSRDGDYPLFARQHAHEFGMASLGLVLESAKPVLFRDISWEDVSLPLLSVDIDEAQADRMIHDDYIDQIGIDIKSDNRLKAIDQFHAEVNIQDRCILLLPLWTVIYQYRGGSYRVAVYGGEEPMVLSAMEPVFMARRIWHLGLGIAAVGGAGLAGYFTFILLIFADSDDGAGLIAAGGAAVLFCMWQAWRTARSMTASINIESIGSTPDVLT